MQLKRGRELAIREVASRTGVSEKTIRYYEDIGLIARAVRGSNGYRQYGEQDVHVLRFVARARSLGFSVAEVRKLLSLWRNKRRKSRDVHAIAHKHIAAIDSKIAELHGLRSTLEELAARCHDDDRPDCPIVEGLAREAASEVEGNE